MVPILVFAIGTMLRLLSPVGSADILLVPYAHGFNSHLMNMEKMADLLMDAGHKASLLINNIVEKSVTNKRATLYIYDMPESKTPNVISATAFLDTLMNNFSFQAWVDFEIPFCKALLEDRTMLPRLKAKNFDLMIIDVGDDCSRIITDYLDIPTILYSSPGFSSDRNIFYPQPPTFVCSPMLFSICTSDEMNFRQRMKIVIGYILGNLFSSHDPYRQYDALRQEYGFNISLNSKDSFTRHVVMINSDFALEFPRPVMPHIITISGIFRKDPKPLTSELEEFFASSGDHGVVVLSFGTLMAAIPQSHTEIFARVFANLPQKVLWRHTGAKPKGLGSNTKLMEWIPQNDLLAHPKTALFITHCGLASTFETAIHGVPVVTVPLFADQHLNSARLVKRAKMGVQVNYRTLNERDLEWAINHVINNKSYYDNAKATAKLMHDSPSSPKDLFLYWVDFVIRHNGAHHLQSAPVRRMSTVQYLGIDVIAVLLIIMFSGICSLACLVIVFIFCAIKRLSPKNKKLKQR